MAPFWLSVGFPSNGRAGSPARHGFHSSLDVVAPSGERLRPVSVRLDAVAGLGWLRTASVASDSVRWFGALASLAERIVAAGAVTPVITPGSEIVPGDVPNVVAEMRWSPVTSSTVDDYLDSLAGSMPPICLPDVAHDDHVTRRHVVATIFERFVDNTARALLQRAGWEPVVPKDRSAATAVVRLVFRALTGQDHRVQATRAVHADALGSVTETMRRLAHRTHNEPVLIRRLRLVVPDDRFDPWRVDLELVDESDPGRWCTAADVWAGNPLAVEVASGPQHLPLLESSVGELAATAAACVDVLAPLGEVDQPAAVELDVEAVDDFLEQAPVALERQGIVLIGPEHLVRATVAVRGRAEPSPQERPVGRLEPRDHRPVDVHRRGRGRSGGDFGGGAGPRGTDRRVVAARRQPLGPHRPGRAAQGPRPP